MSTNTLTGNLLQSTDTTATATTTAATAPVDGRAGRIAEIVCEHLEVEPGEIGPDDQFVTDHGADSLMLIGVLAALEKEFKIGIDQAELVRMTSIAGVYSVVAQSAGW